MEYWLCVLDEVSDQTGIVFSDDQRKTAAGILESAASVRGEYQSHSEPAPDPVVVATGHDRKQAWWEDPSKLCGSDWVLARQIHELIGSRYA